jgi:ABC-2 type transport system permease protein
MKKKELSRQMKSGIYSVLISLVMVAMVIGFNLIVSLLPETAMKIDTTSEGLYTFSPQTEQVLAGLDEDVAVYLIVEPGKEDDYVVNILGRYAQLSSHIKVEQINPLINPTFTMKYTDETVENNGVIVTAGGRSMLVQKEDMFTYGFDYTYYTYSTVFGGESKITGAISYVTGENLPVVYTLSGHGEAALSDTLSDSITTENIELQSLDLVSAGSMPENAAAVMMISPQSDISADEKELLESYLDGGGRLLLVSGYSEEGLPNLYSLMAAFGMEPVKGVIIEGDAAHSVSGYSYYLLPDIQSHEITEPLIADNADVLTPTAMGLLETESHRSSLKVTPLLVTSGEAYSKADPNNAQTFDREEGDLSGPFNVGMAAEEEYGDTNIRVAWYGSDMMILEQVDSIVSGSNTDLFVNTIGWMCDKEDSINVRAKSTLTSYLTVTTSFKNLMGIVITAVLPAAALIAGVVIYMRRRRRK